MTRRVFIVGTDTEIGKTTVSVALLHAARSAGRSYLPFKPAVSGDLGPGSDHARLVRAAPHFGLSPEEITSYRFEPPIAPGLAEADHPFYEPPARRPNAAAPQKALAQLEALERTHGPDLSLIEGAGGLHVPMPGGDWLPSWITALGATPVVVGRAGLGTLNHTILTVEALRTLELAPPAFILNARHPQTQATIDSNRRVLEARLGIPCLGVLPHCEDESDSDPDAPRARAWLRPDTLELLEA